MNRGEDGRFIKLEKKSIDENYIYLPIPNFKSILTLIISIFILLPWLLIIYRNDVLPIIIKYLDGLISGKMVNLTNNGEVKTGTEDKTSAYWK